jgi:2-oxoglutarate dehydrogenase E1 component
MFVVLYFLLKALNIRYHLITFGYVQLGKVRAKQFYMGDENRSKSMPLLLHGDGSFAGQGIVMETLDMSGLPDYTVGGCIHIVVNNQVRYHPNCEKHLKRVPRLTQNTTCPHGYLRRRLTRPNEVS